MDLSISVLRVVGCVFSFSIKFQKTTASKKERPDQKPHYAVSDLGLCFLPMSHKKDTSGLYGLSWHSKVNLKPKVTLQS